MPDRPNGAAPGPGSGRAGLAVGTGVLALLAAFALKAWCGIPGSGPDLYLRWCYSDVPPLWYAERLHEGAIPYLDHPVEYPVLTGLAMWLANLPAGGPGGFFAATALLLLAGGTATAVLLAREVGATRALAFTAAPTLVVSGMVNWDLIAVGLATAGIVAHRRGRDLWSGVALGLGTAAKLYPVVLLPAVALAAARLRGSRAGVAAAGGAAGVWLAVNLPVALLAPEGWARFLTLSRDRPSDWDALWTVAGRITGWGIATPELNLLTGALFVLGGSAILAFAISRDPPDRWHLAGLPLVAWFLLTSKVYSPQFSLWLLPLLALAFPGWAAWAAFSVADVAVTATRFPYLANHVGDGIPGAWPWWPYGTALVARAGVLAAVAWFGWRRAAGQPAQRGVAG